MLKKGLVSGVGVLVLFGALFGAVLNVPVAGVGGTIYIRADGSVEPSTAPISNLNNVIYTFTDNITDPVVIERDNIVVEGTGHAIQGTGTGTGIDLSYRNNVTLRNLMVRQFNFGIYLNHSTSCAIVENIVMGNRFEAIRLYESSNNNITSNDIIATETDGIVLYGSSDNKVDANNLTDNYEGIRLYESSRNDISKNSITKNYYGIFLASSSNNSIFRNNVTANDGNGVSLVWSSSENRIVENHIAANKWCGIYLNASSNNMIYHNSFVDNAQQTSVNDSVNIWNEGYPSAGNYWSDYTGEDFYSGSYQNETGSDGIDDAPRIIDVNNMDHYPLMGMFSDFKATSEYYVQTICNSSISDFQFNGTAIRCDVTGNNDATGFCRICIPTALINAIYKVFVNGTEVSCNLLPCSNETYSYLYFNYMHSTQEVIIISEFPSFLILPLFMIATLFVIIVSRRKRFQHQMGPQYMS